MTEICKSEEKVEVRPCFLSDILKELSELETDIWNHGPIDKVRIQNIIISLKSELIRIDKEQKEIITVNGFKYKRVFE